VQDEQDVRGLLAFAEEEAMPVYEYRCEKCGEKFQRVEHVAEHEAHQVRCPKCGSEQVNNVVSAFYAKTSKKS